MEKKEEKEEQPCGNNGHCGTQNDLNWLSETRKRSSEGGEGEKEALVAPGR